MDGFIGEIRMFGGNFAPAGWLFCQGQSLDINEYDTLFYLIGTTYGGDGQTTFNLPNLSGRLPVGTGQIPGTTTNYVAGQLGGTVSNTLSVANLPMHSHPLTGQAGILSSGEDGHRSTPVNNSVAANGDTIYSTTTDGSAMAPANVSLVAASSGTVSPTAIPNIKPVMGMNYIISLFGIFPTQQ